MPHAVSLTPGLQALILCGPGSSFPTFTADPDKSPKALLPIANRPMLWYPIDFCSRMGITDITVICPSSAADAITTGLRTNPYLTSPSLPRPDILSPKGLDYNTGTAEIFRLPEVKSIVKSDFLVLPCDLICELGGDKLLQAWMVKAASLTDFLRNSTSKESQHSGGLGVWYQTKTATPIKGQETDFIATVPSPPSLATPPKGSLLPHITKLVYSMPTDSLNDIIEDHDGAYPVRHGLLRAHPHVRLRTTHRDAHIYIFPKWVMEFIAQNEGLETLGEDVIGWWAKAGWQKGLHEKLGLKKILHKNDNEGGRLSMQVGSGSEERLDAATVRDSAVLRAVTSAGKDAAIDSNLPKPEAADAEGDIPSIFAYMHPSTDDAPLIRRVDTAKLLLQTSLQLAKLPSVEELAATGEQHLASPFAHAKKVAYPDGVRARTTITRQDSLVGENVTVEEKTSIKESVVGANCQISEGAKLQQCVLMDGVVVGKNCKLTRCILGKRSVIGHGCVLTECEVQENLAVEPKTEAKEEKLMSSSGLEATEEEIRDSMHGMGLGDDGE